MLVYVVRRLMMMVPLVLGVLLVTFIIIQGLPGSPVEKMLGEAGNTAEERDRLNKRFGLDRPLYVQFGLYLSRLVQGDLGTTMTTREKISEEMLERLPNTLRLSLFAILLATVLGIGGGVVSAVWRGSIADHVVRFFSIFGLSTPIFWFGLMLMLLFAVQLRWLPASGDGQGAWFLVVFPALWDPRGIHGLMHLVLPAITLGLRPAAYIGRVTRAHMLEVLEQDYIRTAKAKGLPHRTVVLKHALRNALIPVVTLIGLDLGSLLSGSVITETIFSFPGLGEFTLKGIHNREYEVILATVLLTSVLFLTANLMVDIVSGWIDPRLRVGGKA